MSGEMGASREALELTARALARRLIRGPRAGGQSFAQSKRPQWIGSAGLLAPIQTIHHGLGSSLKFGVVRPLSHETVRLLMSAHVLMSGSERASHSLLGGSVGLIYTPHPHRFTPHVGLGLLAGYQWCDHIKREVTALDPQQLLIGARDELVIDESGALRPWVEIGWAWRGGFIEPGLSVRYHVTDFLYEERGPALSVSVDIAWRSDADQPTE